MKWKIFLGIALIGILVAAGVYYYVFFKSAGHSDPLKSEDKIVIKADELFALYVMNEDSANRMYLDSVISVSGNINYIEMNSGRYTITLNSNDSSGAVICEMDPTVNDKIKLLKIGTVVNVVGFCNGFLTDVQLDRCKLNE